MRFLVKNIDSFREIELPLSKSESNRALMMAFYAAKELDLKVLSDSDDTVMLYDNLKKIKESDGSCLNKIECGNAGTVFRFLMTALSMEPGEWLLSGDERMNARPIRALVDALRSLGADIQYHGDEFRSPILLRGCRVEGGETEVSAEQSSQFASSLMLAAPLWKKGLKLHLKGNIASLPYIDMTINMMRKAGIDVYRNDDVVYVKHGSYDLEDVMIEPDWSAAAFWYEMLALSSNLKIFIKDLKMNSLQADSISVEAFAPLGVKSYETEKGVMIEKTDIATNHFTFDFKHSPDIFPAVAACCAGLKMNATFTGLKNLTVKESDRKKAMMNELSKINVSFEQLSDDSLNMLCPKNLPYFTENEAVTFENYNDHRIAMALSLLSLKIGYINMENIDVVSKSYPDFFKKIL